MNMIRLGLAALVLFAHSFYLAGAGEGPHVRGENLGGWAVAGFFGLSGFLITGSRFTNGLGEYLVHRVARIYPAFLVCLVVTVAVFAPLGYVHQNGTLAGYWTTETTPLRFVFSNLFLEMKNYDVAFTPAVVPFAGSWNGSLWSLYYEFLCYLVIAAIGGIAWVRRSPLPLALAFAVSVIVYANLPAITPLLADTNFALLAKLLPFFLGGAVIQALSKWIGLHWAGGLGSIFGAVLCVALVPTWGGQLAAPLIAYGLLWVSSVLPSPRLVRVHDVSYGFYIYAWPVQQLLALYGVHNRGMAVYILSSGAGTLVLALASWLLVERPVMRAVRRRRKTSSVPAAVGGAAPATGTGNQPETAGPQAQPESEAAVAGKA
ncbi:peptidoglycan/LPS O-acetylase OafA/YrhL [Pseudarthrobacter sp. W1I19]|uniref:acyltransferase family protein n=1 Tax=Pseudarthrobacter sp. W1I19 TaxID=3042288 RepID=UPI00277FB4EE|nr:acyltransferase [Pseudarthrobacter sp. W1I19]MDQ0922848.1 peptidoglycan/LPS O-acetylase OafA/YrhL [Pseudarthrobacter sp. W1I19]